MNKKMIGMAIAAGTLAFAAGSQAALIIDDFSVATTGLITSPGAETNTINSDFSVDRVGSITDNGGVGGANYIVTGGQLATSAGVSTSLDTVFDYANAAGVNFSVAETGGGNIFNAFFLELLTIDQGGVDITLTVNGISATQSISNPGDITFAHSLFGGVTNVTSIKYDFHNNDAVDATFDSFGSYGTQAVPEPTGIALLGLGFCMLGLARKKKA